MPTPGEAEARDVFRRRKNGLVRLRIEHRLREEFPSDWSWWLVVYQRKRLGEGRQKGMAWSLARMDTANKLRGMYPVRYAQLREEAREAVHKEVGWVDARPDMLRARLRNMYGQTMKESHE